jgi:serine phosphatase RsbU (regulator of sigma subunit)
MVDVVEGDGGLRLVGVAHADPARAEQVRTLRRRRPVEPDAAEGVASVVRTGRPVLLERLSHGSAEVGGLDPDLAALVEDFGVRSIMIVPIARGDRIFGAMRFAWAGSPFAYDREDLALAEDLGHRAAIALENASLFEAERAARALETRSRERLQTLAEAGAAMAETLDGRRMLAALVRTTSRRLADIAAAYRVDRFGTPVDVVTAHRDPALDPVLQRAATIRFPDPEDRHHLVSQVLRTGAPVFEPAISESTLNEVRATEEQRALGRRLRPTSGIAVPLSARGRLLGVLALVRGEASPPFVPEDLDLAVELARRAGSLLDNARLYAERHAIADTLQRSLLPPDLPEVPGLEIGARYRPADPGTTVGGDFYDVFEMDVEHWGVVIGDVVGKGAQAAAMMGLARYTVRTAALTESRPSSLLSTLNDAILRQMPESMFCTACVARVRREGPSVRVTVCTGGHPLPFVVRGDGSVLRVGEPGTLLGVFEDPALHDVVFDLDPGDALVLYTDGVTDERRDGDEEFGERRLQSLLASHAGRSAEEIAAAVDDAVASFRTGAARDDVAVLVVRVER